MDTLESNRMFVRVAGTGSFTKAAALARVTTPQVSRSVTDLELRLRVRLFNRTTRRISLTEAGELYLQRCQQILSDLDLAEAEATGATGQPAGKLRIHGTTSFGQHYLAPLIACYGEQFPDVRFDLVLAQLTPDLIEEGFDVSIVVATALADSALISQRLGAIHTVLFASLQYVSRRSLPASVQALAGHTCLMLQLPDVPHGHWLFDGADGEVFRHPASTPPSVNVAEAIREGVGIGPLPVPVVLGGLRDSTLVRVLPQHHLRATNVFALYASRRYLDAKIGTFVEFLRDAVPAAIAERECELARPETASHPRLPALR